MATPNRPRYTAERALWFREHGAQNWEAWSLEFYRYYGRGWIRTAEDIERAKAFIASKSDKPLSEIAPYLLCGHAQ